MLPLCDVSVNYVCWLNGTLHEEYRIWVYFLKVIKGKLPKKVKIKTNSNFVYKLKYHTNSPIVQLEELFS